MWYNLHPSSVSYLPGTRLKNMQHTHIYIYICAWGKQYLKFILIHPVLLYWIQTKYYKHSTLIFVFSATCFASTYYQWTSFIPLACAEWDDSLPFSGASSSPLCYVLFLATLLHQLFFHTLSLHLAIYFLVYLSILLFPNSYTILFWEFYFLPFSVHAQTNVIYLTLLSLL